MIATLCAALLLGQSATPDVSILWIEPPKLKFPTWTDTEARGNLIEAIDTEILKGLKQENLVGESIGRWGAGILNGRIDFKKKQNRIFSRLEEIAKESQARIFVILDVTHVVQRNQSVTEMLNKMDKPGSETRTHVSGLLFNAKEGQLVTWPEKEPFVATVPGPYFGTTDRNEIAGPPDVEVMVIRTENRKRLTAIGRGVWEAIKDAVVKAAKSPR